MPVADFERIGLVILDEFFTLEKGRYIQRRLKREYETITLKKTARQNAGKMGGAAKSSKTKDIRPSNATILLGDTRASPEPEPEPEKEITPKPPRGPRKRVHLKLLAGHESDFERWWLAYPRRESKGKAEKSYVQALADDVTVETLLETAQSQ